MTGNGQHDVDRSNERFWDELCGTALAVQLGVTDASPASLARFDAAYLEQYPYLDDYLPAGFGGAPVLEIGLGYGTLSQRIAERGAAYHGLDIAPGPVRMVRHRLELIGRGDPAAVVEGSALDIPFADGSFAHVYSIGCLHHTGDLQRAVDEVHRVLAPGGRAVVMVYHRWSFQQLVDVPLQYLAARRRGERPSWSAVARWGSDSNQQGEGAPHTDFVSRREARRLFSTFSDVRIETRNWISGTYLGGRITIRRERVLDNVARVLGNNLYITAIKPR